MERPVFYKVAASHERGEVCSVAKSGQQVAMTACFPSCAFCTSRCQIKHAHTLGPCQPLTWSTHAQVRGFVQASMRSASGLPGSGVTLYSHRDVSGKDMRIDSILPPVFKPNVVPLS